MANLHAPHLVQSPPNLTNLERWSWTMHVAVEATRRQYKRSTTLRTPIYQPNCHVERHRSGHHPLSCPTCHWHQCHSYHFGLGHSPRTEFLPRVRSHQKDQAERPTKRKLYLWCQSSPFKNVGPQWSLFTVGEDVWSCLSAPLDYGHRFDHLEWSEGSRTFFCTILLEVSSATGTETVHSKYGKYCWSITTQGDLTTLQFGDGLLITEGEVHMRSVSRKAVLIQFTNFSSQWGAMSPAFSNSAIRDLVPIFLNSMSRAILQRDLVFS